MRGHTPATPISPTDPTPAKTRRATLIALLAIALVAALLRLPALSDVPQGLHQDEAANAWNAYCILKTGQDQVGARWPAFYYRALGENRSALFLYALLPFQALGGLSIWTSRLPSAMCGIGTVLLTYWVVRRLFGRGTGLAAAALLAINPTHIQMSRFGHEGALTPLLTLAPLAALLWAGLPLDDRTGQRVRPWRALLAGLLTGTCCYGYPAVRLYLPVFLTCCVVVNARGWCQLAKTRPRIRALVGLTIGVAVSFGPLVYKHFSEPWVIGKRGENNWIWRKDDSTGRKLELVANRYVSHFRREFLFERGDADAIVWTANFGFIPYYLLPVQVLGLVVLGPGLRRSRAARVLLVGVVLYPVGDLLNWHVSLHSIRSLPGLIALITLGALGLTRAIEYLGRQRLRVSLIVALVAFGAPAAAYTLRFLREYAFERPKQLPVYRGMGIDLLAAYRWLGPRLEKADAVVCTSVYMNQSYLLVLVDRGYDPERWFAEPREVDRGVQYGIWDRYTRFGKYYFMDGAERDALFDELRANSRADHVLLLLRRGEPAPGEPIHVINGPDGVPALEIYELDL